MQGGSQTDDTAIRAPSHAFIHCAFRNGRMLDHNGFTSKLLALDEQLKAHSILHFAFCILHFDPPQTPPCTKTLHFHLH